MSSEWVAPNIDLLLRLLIKQEEAHALILLSPTAEIVGWLAGAERIFGYRAEEILGQSVERLFTPEDVARRIPFHEVALAKNTASEDDRWQIRKDGGRFWASGLVVVLRNDDGELVGYAKILRNRTDQMTRIEALENRVAALEALNARMKLQLASVTHELRGPLAPLVNGLELIQMLMPASKDLEDTIDLMRRQVTHLERLINDLLDAARLRAGKLRLRKQRVDLREILQTSAESCRTMVDERRQQLHVMLPPTPLPVDADRDRLHQVFINLITNAVRYSSEQGEIWLKATVEEDDAVVRVADRGIGISAEMLPRIFDLFVQEESAAAHATEGLGIGLTLVKNLVTQHRGQVLVRSDGKNRGAEFTVRLPLASSETAESNAY